MFQLMTLTLAEQLYGMAMSLPRFSGQSHRDPRSGVMLAGRGPPCPHPRREMTLREAIEGHPRRTPKLPHQAAGCMMRRSGLLARD